jgi:hypothetical protein
LQQGTLFALDNIACPESTMIAAMIVSSPVVFGTEVAQGIAGMWWLYFGRGGELAGVAIIEAPTLYHARTRVAVGGIGKACGVQRREGTR